MSASAERQQTAPDDTEPVNFSGMLRRLDADVAALPPGLIKSFKFDLNGMKVDIRRVAQDQGFRFLITVVIGYLPFSIESTERRAAIRQIIAATQSLPNLRFTVEPDSKIIAGGVFDMDAAHDPDFFFYPLILFIQEARPFMNLIGQYL